MQDLEIAKNRLSTKKLTLSIVKNAETLFESNAHGISGLLEAIEKLEEKLEGASVADRVVGKAIALLCVYAGVKAVYALILSEKAKEIFENYNVHHEWKIFVEKILDVNKRETCPFEKLAINIFNPQEAYEKFKTLQKTMKCRGKNE
ncbi:MAG: DUF1893 domain-containing protein [Candidatus Bathyarchaeia archaeon]